MGYEFSEVQYTKYRQYMQYIIRTYLPTLPGIRGPFCTGRFVLPTRQEGFQMTGDASGVLVSVLTTYSCCW
jgi:hypothetical protein